MSNNNGRRILVNGIQARNLETKSALYDAFADLIAASPKKAEQLGIRLLPRRERDDCNPEGREARR